jgi:hypothetical protein
MACALATTIHDVADVIKEVLHVNVFQDEAPRIFVNLGTPELFKPPRSYKIAKRKMRSFST